MKATLTRLVLLACLLCAGAPFIAGGAQAWAAASAQTRKGAAQRRANRRRLRQPDDVMLRPKLLRELRPGSLIISHDFRMGDWPPEKTIRVPWKNLYRTVYVWTVPRGGRYRKG